MVKNKEGVFIMNDYDRQDLIKQRAGLEPPAHEGDYGATKTVRG